MEIYILRHGIAEDPRPGMPDSRRALTPEGIAKLKSVLRRARSAGVEPAVILTSPYLRARQTAEIAASSLRVEAALVETRALVPESSPEAVWDALREHAAAERILLAGHEPLLGAVYAFLLGEPGVRIEVKKGSLGRIDVERPAPRPRGALRFLLTAKLAED
jgi:phosphohistidine phosphatase